MSHGTPSCPKCGEATSVRNLRDAFAAQVALIQQAMATPPPEVAEPEPTHAGSGTNADPAQLLVGAVMELLLQAGKATVDAAVVRPASAWWQTKGQTAVRERREKLVRSLQESLDRHPELYVCAKDDVVFLPGARSTVPTRRAVELLFKGDDARLMAMLKP